MNEGIIILVVIAIAGLAYFGCGMTKRGTFDVGKCFTLLVIVFSLVTGIFIVIHAFVFLKAKGAYSEDEVWSAIAGMVLFFWSAHQTVIMFREVFAKRVDPIKSQQPREDNPQPPA